MGREKKHILRYRLHFYILFVVIFALLGFIGGYAYYKFYYVNYHDTSLNGSEIKEVHQNTIPADVQKEIQSEINQKVYTAPGHFPSTPSSPAPLAETIKVPILMYHYVEYVQDKGDKTRISLNITPYTLEEEIKTLIGANYTFLTNKELADVLDGKVKLPQKPILLTFDDGYRDFYTDVFPILKKYNIKATEYVIAGFLNRPNHLLTRQVEEIIQSGLVEIGAHTVHHAWLKGRPLKEVSAEIFQSRVMLEHQFKINVTSFAYPYGAFDAQAMDVVKDAGFKTAVSTIPGIQQNQLNRFFLYRLRPGGRTGLQLLDFLNQEKFKP